MIGTMQKAGKGPKSYQTYILNPVVPDRCSEPQLLEVKDLPDDGDHAEGRKKSPKSCQTYELNPAFWTSARNLVFGGHGPPK